MIPFTKLFDDILKGLPENAVLRGKLSELKAQVAELEARGEESRTRIAELEEKLRSLTSTTFDATELQILTALAGDFDGATVDHIANRFKLHPTKTQYHLDRLFEAKLAYGQGYTDGRPQE
jgi:DNA-binding transcriptional ArsR family regulator